jgi:hypothetical protein
MPRNKFEFLKIFMEIYDSSRCITDLNNISEAKDDIVVG